MQLANVILLYVEGGDRKKEKLKKKSSRNLNDATSVREVSHTITCLQQISLNNFQVLMEMFKRLYMIPNSKVYYFSLTTRC